MGVTEFSGIPAYTPNTGIKSMESRPADDYKDLLYVRRRFVSTEGLRQATARVVNATLAARLPRIWGEATTRLCVGLKAIRGLGPESAY